LASIWLLLVLVGPVAAAAQDPEIIKNRYDDLIKHEDYNAALREAQKYQTATRAKDGEKSSEYAGALRALAEVYEKLKEFEKSEGYFKQATHLYEELDSSEALIETLTGLASLYRFHKEDLEKTEATLKAVVAVREKELNPETLGSHQELARSIFELAEYYQDVHRPLDAEKAYSKVVALYEHSSLASDLQAHRSSYSELVDAMTKFAGFLERQSEYDRAAGLYLKLIAMHERAAADRPETVVAHYLLGTFLELGKNYAHQGKVDDAEKIYQKAISLATRCANEPCKDVALYEQQYPFRELAELQESRGHYKDAEETLQRLLEIGEKAATPDDLTYTVEEDFKRVVTFYSNFGRAYRARETQARLVALYLNGLDALKRPTGGAKEQSAEWMTRYNAAVLIETIARAYRNQQDYQSARVFYERLLAEQQLDPNDRRRWQRLLELAFVNEQLGRTDDAARLRKRATAEFENVAQAIPDQTASTNNLHDFVTQLRAMGHFELIEQPLTRLLNLIAASRVARPELTSLFHEALGQLYLSQTRFEDAVREFGAALTIADKEGLSQRRYVNAPALGLISAYRKLGRNRDADRVANQLLQRLARQEAERRKPKRIDNFLDGLFAVMADFGILATYQELGRFDEAERRLGMNRDQPAGAVRADPRQARLFDILALRYSELGADDLALSYSRRATAAIAASEIAFARSRVLPAALKAASLIDASSPGSFLGLSRAEDFVHNFSDASPIARRDYFEHHLSNLAAAALRKPDKSPELGSEALEVAQRADSSAAGAALDQMVARFASKNDKLATMVRESQDLGILWQNQTESLNEGIKKQTEASNKRAVPELRDRITETESRFAALTAQIDREFPEYSALISPKPLAVADIQKLLGEDEALVFLFSGSKATYVFAVANDRFSWKALALEADDLAAKVKMFRHGLDVDLANGDCSRGGRGAAFDLNFANQLYTTLLGPVASLVKDKKQLLIVSSGALTALPFHLLVTERPRAGRTEGCDSYRDAAWLIKRQAVDILPSVGSLRALRALSRSGTAGKPMVGFGDPLFNPRQEKTDEPRSIKTSARSVTSDAFTEFWRGEGLDRSALVSLRQLPDTRDELIAVALALGASPSDIHLGRDASETVVKQAPLADYRIVYFATHGLVAGDVRGLAEPSLALSIPEQPSELDDGLLTASEVVQLKLNADWVVLSACNTIAGDKPGAEALSGLARAFFYAGARALLVSHWAVYSPAATRLATTTFDLLKKDPGLGRAEALRQAMLAYLADKSSPDNAYPAIWGPFAIIGEGGSPPSRLPTRSREWPGP
jgi:CHAT domain-containing protein/tetratricopeptide (TPR) repeat protein